MKMADSVPPPPPHTHSLHEIAATDYVHMDKLFNVPLEFIQNSLYIGYVDSCESSSTVCCKELFQILKFSL